MPIKTYREAVKEALAQEMEHDERVVLIGELAAVTAEMRPKKRIEAFGGVLGVTKGLWTQFGSDRVIDTPITESAIVGMAAGAAATGLRPVAELMFMDFFGVSHDALYNQAAKFRYMFGGKAKAPLVMRGMIGAGFSAAAQHSQSPYNIFATTPGLKVVVPSTPYDVKGLLIQSIRDDDPVVFCEHKMLYDLKGEVPDEIYTIP
jgi:pyruvate dehydrogenase E1 component beta subunit